MGVAMKRVPVVSSALRSVGYDTRTLTLEVEFVSGEIYDFHGVEPDDVVELLEARSIGTYLNRHIKPKYRYTHVVPE